MTNLRPTEGDLLERARGLLPMLRENAEATELNRALLPETVAAFEAAGFYRILQPAVAKSSDDPFVRQRIAEADAIIRGLRQRLESVFAALDACIEAGAAPPIELRVQAKWDAQHLTKEAARAIELLFKASGARGIRLSNPLQRYFRDVHAASNHAFLNADKGSLNAGGVLMGAMTSDFSV